MIMKQYYLDELKDRLQNTNESVFHLRGTTKQRVLSDNRLLEKMWTIFQKNIEEYDCDEDWSYQDAFDSMLPVKITE